MFSEKFVSAGHEYATFDKHIPAPYMRKKFHVSDRKSVCKITICGLGLYRLFLNGKEITKTYMAPYVSNVDEVLYYDEYILTDGVREGENVLGILLGNGMLNSIGGYVWFFDEAPFRSAPKVAFALEVGEEIIEADETVKVYDSPIVFNDIRAGERYDARKEIAQWATPEFDDTGWHSAVVAECPKGEKRIADIDPIIVEKEIKPVSILKGDNGYIYDFGINTAGIVRLQVRGTDGQTIKIVHCELVNDGKADLSNINFGNTKPDYNQCIVYTCKDGEQVYQPSFCYMGFRYAYVTGISEEQATEDLLTMLVMHSDVKQAAGFTCSDENINKLYNNTINSTLSNFYHFLTDCPQREKNGWTGDVCLGANQVMLNFAAQKNLKEWLYNVQKAQDEAGNIPCVVPTTGWGYYWNDSAPWESGPAWDAALIETPYRILQYTDELSVVEENADAIFKWITYLNRKIDADGLVAIGLGDWCQVNGKIGDMFTTPVRVTDTLISMDACQKAAVLFERIQQQDRVCVCKDIAERLKTAFRKHCITKDLYVVGYTQTGLAMALYYGAFERDERERAFQNLLQLIAEKDDHFDVGVLGGRVLFRVLSDFGDTALAKKLLLNDTYPSFLYPLQFGATSLWESFHELNKRFEPINGFPGEILSQNHFFWGDIAAYFIEYFAGLKINPNNDDYRNIVIQPVLGTGLQYIEAYRNMSYGCVRVRWTLQGSIWQGKIDIPPTAKAQCLLPNGELCALHIGENTIQYCDCTQDK